MKVRPTATIPVTLTCRRMFDRLSAVANDGRRQPGQDEQGSRAGRARSSADREKCTVRTRRSSPGSAPRRSRPARRPELQRARPVPCNVTAFFSSIGPYPLMTSLTMSDAVSPAVASISNRPAGEEGHDPVGQTEHLVDLRRREHHGGPRPPVAADAGRSRLGSRHRCPESARSGAEPGTAGTSTCRARPSAGCRRSAPRPANGCAPGPVFHVLARSWA